MKYSAVFIFIFVSLLNSISFTQNNPLVYPNDAKVPNGSYAPLPVNDSVTGTWKILQPLPQNLYGVNAYYIQNLHKVFICGGNGGDSSRSKCYFYDPASDTYVQKASLPMGRSLGKLVRVRDSLYLVGSVGNNFLVPDGKIFKYDINNNVWSERAIMPQPFLIESAVCSYRDTLIYTIGGSSSGWGEIRNLIRIYDPYSNTWQTSPSLFPINVTSAHAESHPDSSAIFVVGGIGIMYSDKVYKGNIDGLNVQWTELGNAPFGFGARVCGGRWNSQLLFGFSSVDTIGDPFIYSLEFRTIDSLKWTKFIPADPSNAIHRQTLAVDQSLDSLRFYAFGGYSHPSIINTAVRYAAAPPIAIGIEPVSDIIPETFKLYQNYPNPFNPATKIKLDISKSSDISFIIYDMIGRELYREEKYLNAGTYSFIFNGSEYASGIYYYRLITKNNFQTRKMILLK